MNDKIVKPRVLGIRRCIDAVARMAATDSVAALDSVPKHIDHLRADASPSLYAATMVRQTLSEFFRHEYPELKWINGGLVYIDESLPEGTSTFEWQEMGVVGEADYVADDATDIPRADIFGQINVGRAKSIATHFRYNRQEIATSKLMGNGINLVTEKSAAARLVMDSRLNRSIALGRPEVGHAGVLNAPGIAVDAATTGNWLSATAAQIVADFTTAWTAQFQATNGLLVADTAVMPIEIYTRLSTLQNSVSSDLTVLEYLQKTAPQIKRWEWDPLMSTASPAGGRAMLLYRNDRTVARALIPKVFEFLPEQESALSIKIIGYCRFAGVIAPKPLGMLLLTGI